MLVYKGTSYDFLDWLHIFRNTRKEYEKSAGEKQNISLQIKVCVTPSHVGYTHAHGFSVCILQSSLRSPPPFSTALILFYANCVTVTSEAFQLVSQTSTEKEMSRKTTRRK